MKYILSALSVCLPLGFLLGEVGADFQTVWQVGEADGSTGDFGSESYATEAAPGSATAKDDHYYLTGTYPAPIGSVAADEPVGDFERSLTSSDPSVSIHFSLTPADLAAGTRFRAMVNFIWSGADVEPPANVVELRLNGNTILTTPSFEDYTIFSVEFDPATAGATAGANSLEIVRTGTTADSYLAIDFVSLEKDTDHFVDTDGDGSSDAWEATAGFDPGDPGSTPPAFAGAIGVNFISRSNPDEGYWSAGTPNGFVPQPYWNHTVPIINWSAGSGSPLRPGSRADISAPQFDTIVDGAGNPTPITLTFTHDGCPSSYNHGTQAARLLNGFLNTRDGATTELDLGAIPFAEYDLYAYVSSEYIGPEIRLRLNSDPASERTVRPQTVGPYRAFHLYDLDAAVQPAYANLVRFEAVTGSDLLLELDRVDGGSAGIAGFQLIDRLADADSDGLPDWWEFLHGTGDATPSSDLDGDGLDLAAEFANGTDPGLADSDDDGIEDGAELALGTDPASPDSDGDGIGDGDEALGLFPTDPTLADTDGDGRDDKQELAGGLDPDDATVGEQSAPTFPAPGRLLWELTDIQIVWNHDGNHETEGGSGRDFAMARVENTAESEWLTFQIGLELRDDALTYMFTSIVPGGFAYASSPSNSIWASDWSDPVDLSSVCGFSGFGRCDISDPLTFRMEATSGPTGNGDWSMTMTILNQATGLPVMTETFDDLVAAASILDGSAQWQGPYDEPGEAGFVTGNGVEVYRSSAPLGSLAAFADCVDSDDDGMPDGWELDHGLDPQSPADALLDPDLDKLNNREEFLADTDPAKADSDGDLASDAIELAAFSDPNDAGSLPPYFFSLPPAGGDLDGNGFLDAWEFKFDAGGLAATGDEDGDGDNNLAEARSGTDPFDPRSNLYLRLEPGPIAGQVDLHWPRIVGKAQGYLQSADLNNWGDGAEPSVQTGDEYRVTLALGERRFFKSFADSRDLDGDGLDDWTEIFLGSNPLLANSLRRSLPHDSNGDGTPDAVLSGDYAAFAARMSDSTSAPSGGSADPSPEEAARLLLQASFGPTGEAIDEVRSLGIEGWIDEQMNNRPATYFRPQIEAMSADFIGPRLKLDTYTADPDDDSIASENIDNLFARAAVSAPDQLRQRVAFALSQILVVSQRDANLSSRPLGLADFYDLFLEHAFGDFGQLLLEVTYHPCMGRYLSHVGNQPPDPAINRYPDENYAREVMQLFSIGLWKLNPDGTQLLDPSGDPVPTYSNAEITEMARVLTGLWFGVNPWGQGGWQDADYAVPMEMHAEYHDFGAKTLLDGYAIPAREPSRANAELDLADAVGHLFDHPNCPPFISRALIQFLVTDNPSPAYVRRVRDVFVDNGSGVRGDLGAVVKAILMDAEARHPAAFAGDSSHGLLREPFIRTMHLARLAKLDRFESLLWWDYGDFGEVSFQGPLASPSVFNFFRPDYRPPGLLTGEGLSGPVFQITNSYSAVSFPNKLWEVTNEGFSLYDQYRFAPDYGDFLPHADDPETLLDYVDLVCCAGQMAAGTREIIKVQIAAVPVANANDRVHLAVYLALMCPEGAVQK